mmetsp:Transcript_19830/g.44556  ORF Transcript_19830/g.44556 Transcript_19830/m.44556 type:complete len:246 (+) Transcript_19830:269-1006(+)
MKQKEDGEYSWYPVMDEMEINKVSVMKFRSSRGKPRIELTEELEDQSDCVDPVEISKKNLKSPVEPCVGPMKNKTFLQVFNCEFIRPPKPSRFERAMKQIYRPSFVLSHFVHYSTVTTKSYQAYSRHLSNYREKNETHVDPIPKIEIGKSAEKFMNEATQGVLVHARSILPHETRQRSVECSIGAKYGCKVGFLCADDVEFVDALHQDNVFHNTNGNYCNCWRNKVIEEVLVPKLETMLLRRSGS